LNSVRGSEITINEKNKVVFGILESR